MIYFVFCFLFYIFINIIFSFFLLNFIEKKEILKSFLKHQLFKEVWLFWGFFLLLIRYEIEKSIILQTSFEKLKLDLNLFFKIDNFLYDFIKNFYVDLNLLRFDVLKKRLKLKICPNNDFVN